MKQVENFLCCCCPCDTENNRGTGDQPTAGASSPGGHDSNEMATTAPPPVVPKEEPGDEHPSTSAPPQPAQPTQPHQHPCMQLIPRTQPGCLKPVERGGEYEGDTEIPFHWQPMKQLHSATGFNLAIASNGSLYGTAAPFSEFAVLIMTSKGPGEVQIKSHHSPFYVAMNDRGKVYSERNPDAENTIWYERYEQGWNTYILKCHAEDDWFLGIKKSGRLKRGTRTHRDQKAVKFVPRPSHPGF